MKFNLFRKQTPNRSDYIFYIDFNAIKLGDTAFEIGDYKCAIQNYSVALTKLRRYQGDSMQPAMMASGLVTKVEKATKMASLGRSILKFETWKLTKTSFVKGSQCTKYLYLDKHKKKEKTPISEEKQKLFKKGHSFEDLVREKEFPGGINIKEKIGNFAYFNSYTKYLLSLDDTQIIYEATLIENELLVMCDVLIKQNDERIDIYEIKLNTKINDAILEDLSVQYYVAKLRFGEDLNSFHVIYRSEEDNAKWMIKNVTHDLENHLLSTTEKVEEYKKILKGGEPNVAMGPQCKQPYECEFIAYCKKNKV